MKKYLFLMFGVTALTKSANSQITMPAKYDSAIKINYVRTWEAMAPITHADTMLTRPYKDIRQTTAYFDGLGKSLQTVFREGSLVTGDTARDLVSPNVYDEFGREVFKFIPFAANNTGSNNSISDGKFKLNPFQQDSTFNKGMFSDETYYYSKSVFETSPLNRILETYAPGNNWVGTANHSNEANRKATKIKVWINTVADSVRIWSVSDVSNSFGTYTTDSSYEAGELFKNVIQDEHNKQVIEFKDKEGNIILKKIQLTADADTGTGKGHNGWLCTYYIYDDFGNLRCVVQPNGVELLVANNWSMSYSSGVILDEQTFRYEYDKRGRMMMKKVPGSGIVYMIYDARDRLVMTQDSLLRAAHKWKYTLYDGLNRDTATGLITDNTYYNDAPYHRSHADTSIAWPNLGSYANEYLTKKFYDNYDWRIWEGNPLSASRSSSYDSYLLSLSSSWPYPQDATLQSNQIRGQVTGTKTEILGTNTYLYTVTIYDDKGRLIQVQNTNQTGGTDIATNQYSWNGQSLLFISKHGKAGTNSQEIIGVTKITYDDLFRPIKTEKKISSTKVNSGSMPGSWTTINILEYDALGQLKKKKFGTTTLDSLQFDYNIRGWSLGMNRSYVKDTTNTSHWFGYDLGYDKTSFTVNGGSQSYAEAQYNGNINGTLWRSTGDDLLRKYDFTYDAANRFLSADFNQLNSNSFSKAAGINFSVSGMSYDANGNILSMNQKGWKLGGSVTIDSLVYGYNSNSNKLNYVTDKTNDSTSWLGDFKEYTNNTSQDYSYDANGSLISDVNKRIALIHYNYLNLPDSISVTGKGHIKYVYDAVGNKIKKITTEGGVVTTTLYLLSVYKNDTLQYISTEEGRARIKDDSSAIVYDYAIKDHLGNVRMLLTNETRTDAYPAATMEDAQETIEEIYYDGLNNTRTDPPRGYPDIPVGNRKVATVKGNTGFGPVHVEIGPGILLKVMAGDSINLQANSWWSDQTAPTAPYSSYGLSQLLSAISGSVSQQNSHYDYTLQYSTELNASVTDFLNNQSYNSNKPKAFVNWLSFDERFNYVASSSGYEQVGGTDTLTSHIRTGLPMNKNGYVYIYVSNETPNIDVFFDNLQVTHLRGPLVEENHYYPFGLMQSGISSTALGFGNSESQKKKYNGIDWQNDLGLNEYDAQLRTLDPQVGRWWQIDPKVDNMEMWSPFVSNYDNPILYSDPLGDEGEACCGGFIGDIVDGFVDKAKNTWHAVTHPVETIKNAFSAEGLKNTFLNTVSFGIYSDAKSVVTEGPGKFIGGKLFDAAAFVVADGIAKNLPLGKAAAAVSTEIKTTVAAGASTEANVASSLGQVGVKAIQESQVKLSKVEKSITTENIGNGKFTKTTQIKPGIGPGQSSAKYVQIRNKDGKMVKMYKDAYDRGNKFQGRQHYYPKKYKSN